MIVVDKSKLEDFMGRHLVNLIHTSHHINQLKQIHAVITTRHPDLTSTFIHRLLNLNITDYAWKVFDEIPEPDERIYNSFISAYCRLCFNKECINTFLLMHRRDVGFSSFTFPPVIKSCSAVSAIELGREVHSLLIHYGLESSLFSQTALMNFYAKTGDLSSARTVFDGISNKDPISYNCLISGYSKCGDVLSARKLFDEMNERTVVSWNSMISCYAHNGEHQEAMRLFERMQAEGGFRPTEFTVVTILSACAKLGNLETGMQLRNFIKQNKTMFSGNMIVSTALIEMLVKCGAVDEARQEFDSMDKKDIISWGAMIAGYAQNGRPNEAIELFESSLTNQEIKPNDVIMVSVLSACAQLGSIEAGERVGRIVEKEGLDSNIYVASALLGMYRSCGNIRKAQQVFEKMPKKDVVSWNAMITGLAFNGYAQEAIELYSRMKEIPDIEPNDITFVGLLTACAHAGLLDLGLEFFNKMKTIHVITPKVEHYACIVDVYCRHGRLNEAYEFITQMKEVEPNIVIWGTLLSACRLHSNTELAEVAVKELIALEPENSGNYVLLSNLYASSGRWEEALGVRDSMRDKKVQKNAAYSWIELENEVHKFLVSDISHPKTDEIYGVVDALTMNSASDEMDVQRYSGY